MSAYSNSFEEGCRRLDSVAGLKSGEKHCSQCQGYGGLPVNKRDPTQTQINPTTCPRCGGTGKEK